MDIVMEKQHSHYFKNVEHLKEIDVYRVLDLFEVTDSAIAHAIKKLLVAGGRGTKNIEKDISESIDSLYRWQIMQEENGILARAEYLKALEKLRTA